MFKKATLSPEKQYSNILEWLYTNDGKYPNKVEWRKEFVIMLRFNVLGIKPEEPKIRGIALINEVKD